MNTLEFACIKHAGQFRKYSEIPNSIPYITHPLRVAEQVFSALYEFGYDYDHGMDKECILDIYDATLLHDVLEDTDTTFDELRGHFGATVATYVQELTNPSKGSSESREVRKQIDREHLAKASDEAQLIKLFDRYDNLIGFYEYIGLITHGQIELDDFYCTYCGETRELLKVIRNDSIFNRLVVYKKDEIKSMLVL